jgi:hypothetical protein
LRSLNFGKSDFAGMKSKLGGGKFLFADFFCFLGAFGRIHYGQSNNPRTSRNFPEKLGCWRDLRQDKKRSKCPRRDRIPDKFRQLCAPTATGGKLRW